MLPVVWGRVPPDFPSGTLLRVGPDVSSAPLSHPLDGQGRIDRISFSRAGIRLEASRVIYTRPGGMHAFGTPSTPALRLHNPGNTSLLHHGGRLFAMWEAGLPIEVHPLTLETIGADTLGGALSGCPPARLLGGDAVGAHPAFDPDTGVPTLLCSSYSANSVRMRLVQLHADIWAVDRELVVEVPWFTHCHGGFASTKDHYVIFAPALRFDAHSFMRGAGIHRAVSPHSERMGAVVVVDRASGLSTWLKCPTAAFVVHVASCVSDGPRIVVSCTAADHVGVADSARLCNVVLDLEKRTVTWVHTHHGRAEFPCSGGGATYAAAEPWGAWLRLDDATDEARFVRCADALHTEPVYVNAAGAPAGAANPRARPAPGGFLLGCAIGRHSRVLVCCARADAMQPCFVADAGSDANLAGLHSMWLPDK